MTDDDEPLFLTNRAWRRLSEWIIRHPALAEQLGIWPDAFTGTITECETTAFLGGMCNVWPKSAAGTIIAEKAVEFGSA